MKLKQNVKTAFIAAFTSSLLAAGTSPGQTAGTAYSYISSPGATQTAALGGAGTFNQTLTASGYASEGYYYLNGANLTDDFTNSTAGEMGVQQGGTLGTNGGNNRSASGVDLGSFSLQGGAGLDGSVETIQSVTLLLYVTAASITVPNPTISIYSGLNNTDLTATALGSFTVSQAQVGTYISFDVPASVAFSGFTLANFNREVPQDGNNFGTEENATVAFQPAYRVNTLYVLPVPEPSAALLGGLGALLLLRRRR